jgi:hypothetical protein
VSKARERCFQDVYLLAGQDRLEVAEEFRIVPDRKWRWDIAIPERRIAIEWQGIAGGGPSHLSFSGAARDMEKHNAAVALGWTMLYANVKNTEDGSFWTALNAVLERTREGVKV